MGRGFQRNVGALQNALWPYVLSLVLGSTLHLCVLLFNALVHAVGSLLDLTTTFDTINHTILLQCLENYLGIIGKVLSWFHSYIANRKQTVHLLGDSSTPRDLDYWVPQGSVLEPFCFSVYLLPLGKIITAHHRGTKYHFCANDSQLYLISELSEAGAANDNIVSLIKDISQWLIANFMCKNDSKTEISILCSIHRPSHILHTFRFGDEFISASNSVTNLGVIFYHHIRMDKHISIIVNSSFC